MTFDPNKDPDAKLDYMWDWADWLAENETISSATFIVPDGISGSDEAKTDTTATVWLDGGTLGVTYNVTCRIMTNQGRTDDRSKEILVTDR